MASGDGPGAEFNDPERLSLLKELDTALHSELSSTAWACLWLSDIEKLKVLVGHIQNDPCSYEIFFPTRVLLSIVRRWTTRSSSVQWKPRSKSEPAPSSSEKSLALEHKLCRKRDGKSCVLEKLGGLIIEVAYICPFRDTNPSSKFWQLCRRLWSDERVSAWKEAFFGDGDRGPQVCHNMMCLSPNALAYWRKALFALKPLRLSDDKKCLDVQIFWLPHSQDTGDVSILLPPHLPSDFDRNTVKLFDCENDRVIQSGDIISLHTDDPDRRPLPSFALLEMQWMWNRVSALSGAVQLQED